MNVIEYVCGCGGGSTPPPGEPRTIRCRNCGAEVTYRLVYAGKTGLWYLNCPRCGTFLGSFSGAWKPEIMSASSGDQPGGGQSGGGSGGSQPRVRTITCSRCGAKIQYQYVPGGDRWLTCPYCGKALASVSGSVGFKIVSSTPGDTGGKVGPTMRVRCLCGAEILYDRYRAQGHHELRCPCCGRVVLTLDGYRPQIVSYTCPEADTSGSGGSDGRSGDGDGGCGGGSTDGGGDYTGGDTGGTFGGGGDYSAGGAGDSGGAGGTQPVGESRDWIWWAGGTALALIGIYLLVRR